jgi:hypothetical protein
MHPSELVLQIAGVNEEDAKREAFDRLQDVIGHVARPRQARYLVPLLYDTHHYIRIETAYLVERLRLVTGLKEADYLQYLFALQDFGELYRRSHNDPPARDLLFDGLRDPSPRIRLKILKHLEEQDAQNSTQQALFLYGHGDYEILVSMAAGDRTMREEVVKLLRHGSDEFHNSAYHRRQCLDALRSLELLDQRGEEILTMLNRKKTGSSAVIDRSEALEPAAGELDDVLSLLNRSGIYVDGALVYPEISVGTVTNRITYRKPGLQTLPREERVQRIAAPPGHRLARFDYSQIEPLILINKLLAEFLLTPADIPEGDIYRHWLPGDRSAAKRQLNALINGAYIHPGDLPTPFALKLFTALEDWRGGLAAAVRRDGYVETLGGNRIELDHEEANFTGKAVNRYVQGSASDLFNNSLVRIHDYFRAEVIAARIYFVLYDEVWIAIAEEESVPVSDKVSAILNSQWQQYNMLLPVRVKCTF